MTHSVAYSTSRRLVLLMILCGALGALPTSAIAVDVDEYPCEGEDAPGRRFVGRPFFQKACQAAGGCQEAVVDGGEAGTVRCGMPAPRYPVPFATPRPTVPTYFTYPPMMPHNSLHHYRGTYSYRHAEGLSRTNVHWRTQKGLNALRYLHHAIELPR